MSSTMAVDKPKAPKIDIDEYLTLALSGTPADLHPYFESFRNLYSRKCVAVPDTRVQAADIHHIDYGISSRSSCLSSSTTRCRNHTE